MSKPLFCAECGGDLKSINGGYKCLNCDKKYTQSKITTRKENNH